MEQSPKRRPGRPATGSEPNAVYLATGRTNLKQAGGKRLEVKLSPDGVADLQVVMEHHQTKTQMEAAAKAIANEASRIRARKDRT